ncbi:CPBP family intramembrane glutamic endopeptidase [Marinitenerispora sediminis]|uniref:CPBP family intramembrane glutamic endopeptidase n=1 Tax=Marinitenerispora sediminis TaxID=1931232 RepID=UPI001F34DBC8|nr:CPBP family intramembrane glutamic endopeptidase [Marinitenerispora sediminis]
MLLVLAAYPVVLVTVMAAATIIALPFGGRPDENGVTGWPVADLAVELFLLACLIPVVALAVRLVLRRPVGTLASVEGRLRLRWLLLCCAVAAVCVAGYAAVLFGSYAVTSPGEPLLGTFTGAAAFAAALAVVLLLVPFQAAAEEYALRGFLMQVVGGYGADPGERMRDGVLSRVLRSPVPAIAVSGVIFALLHDYSAWAMADVAIFGLAMAWLTWYTGGLEAAVALHVLHNTVLFALSAYDGSYTDAGTGSGSWYALVGTGVEVGLYVVLVVWLARRLGVRRTVPDGG